MGLDPAGIFPFPSFVGKSLPGIFLISSQSAWRGREEGNKEINFKSSPGIQKLLEKSLFPGVPHSRTGIFSLIPMEKSRICGGWEEREFQSFHGRVEVGKALQDQTQPFPSIGNSGIAPVLVGIPWLEAFLKWKKNLENPKA